MTHRVQKNLVLVFDANVSTHQRNSVCDFLFIAGFTYRTREDDLADLATPRALLLAVILVLLCIWLGRACPDVSFLLLLDSTVPTA